MNHLGMSDCQDETADECAAVQFSAVQVGALFD
jgi:hypothetical protein